MKSFAAWLVENDADHAAALQATGFWGKQGAGCIILARSTGRILLPHRSSRVQEPNTWGVWGGAIDSDEDPGRAARREAEEEAGYSGNISMIPLSVFSKGDFRYHNFLAVVDDEFEPRLNWETQDAVWTTLDSLPSPLHFGLRHVLSTDGAKIRKIIDALLLFKP